MEILHPAVYDVTGSLKLGPLVTDILSPIVLSGSYQGISDYVAKMRYGLIELTISRRHKELHRCNGRTRIIKLPQCLQRAL